MLSALRTRLFKPQLMAPLRQASSSATGDSKASQVSKIVAQAAQTQDKSMENASHTRVFFAKATYHPRELNEATAQRAMRERMQQQQKRDDPFVAMGINPLVEYKNTYLLSNFVSEMGRIRPRHKTGLTAKSQRRVAKAIKRARAFGLMPITSKFNPMYNYKSLGRGSR
ncbi:ribosomal protein S18 [Linderina pennispora]|uniref:Small ribosomal subunit protein bS18m n=1 Tax=Linderina pennispora TaxID=61395 RepID=A0A1Y1W4M6_9FUNG|nr:ribosomal protein S18 [Linderina pennispora]ORX68186.1 ribosomal protein S18 [Linderina pennispora]